MEKRIIILVVTILLIQGCISKSENKSLGNENETKVLSPE